MDIRILLNKFCKENNLSISISHNMPSEYETAYGTYDVTSNTLFLNLSMLQNHPEYEVLFYLYHELRHVVQYLHPARFEQVLQDSLPYVILYNGICFRLADNTWYECRLSGDNDYFIDAYLSLPYESDANNFAYETVKRLLNAPPELEKIYMSWLPKNKLSSDELRKLYDLIDEKVGL